MKNSSSPTAKQAVVATAILTATLLVFRHINRYTY